MCRLGSILSLGKGIMYQCDHFQKIEAHLRVAHPHFGTLQQHPLKLIIPLRDMRGSQGVKNRQPHVDQVCGPL